MDAFSEVSERMMRKFSDTELVNENNIEYYRQNQKEIVEEHEGRFIAIIDTRVVESIEPPQDISDVFEFVEYIEDEYGHEQMKSAYMKFVADFE